MSMLTFFPSLKPSVSSSICFDVDQPVDDESELRELEREHEESVNWIFILCRQHFNFIRNQFSFISLPANQFDQTKAIQFTAVDLVAFGRNPPAGGAEQDTDDDGTFLAQN